MEQTSIIQDAEFKKRRNQKNWIVMGLIMTGVALIWAVTMLKMENGMQMAHPIGVSVPDAPQKASEGDSNAQ